MLQILSACWDLLAGLVTSLVDVVSLVATWGYSVLYHLHMDAPRLEGLLIGVGLAWLLSRRDRHPVIKVVSAPLKLVLDILDLAWDQVVESLKDVKKVVTSLVSGSVDLAKGRVLKVWGWGMSRLTALRDRLLKKKSD